MKKILSLMILGAALAVLTWLAGLVVQSWDALQWAQTQGRVTSSSLTLGHLPALEPDAQPMRVYGADVEYEYKVKDGLYTSNRVGINDQPTRKPKNALQVVNKYRHKLRVIVFYNPADPTQAVLEPWNIGDVYVPIMIAGALMLVWLIAFSDQAIKVASSKVDDHLRWGNSYQRLGKFEQALDEYSMMIAIAPYLAQGYKSRGSLYLRLGRWDDAITDLSRARSINPTDPLVYFNRAKAFLGKEQYDRAWADAEQAMEKGIKIKPAILAQIQKGLSQMPAETRFQADETSS